MTYLHVDVLVLCAAVTSPGGCTLLQWWSPCQSGEHYGRSHFFSSDWFVKTRSRHERTSCCQNRLLRRVCSRESGDRLHTSPICPLSCSPRTSRKTWRVRLDGRPVPSTWTIRIMEFRFSFHFLVRQRSVYKNALETLSSNIPPHWKPQHLATLRD